MSGPKTLQLVVNYVWSYEIRLYRCGGSLFLAKDSSIDERGRGNRWSTPQAPRPFLTQRQKLIAKSVTRFIYIRHSGSNDANGERTGPKEEGVKRHNN